MNRKGMTLAEILMSMLVLAAAALAVTSTIAVTNSKQMRNASSGTGGGSLDLQAISHARAQLELLKDAVSTNSAFNTLLLVSATSYNTTSTLPSTFQSAGGTRVYLVSSVGGGTDLKKVKVTVQWTEP
jgi:prepilin-type N-terminal cleavage/methylation domain-containing protein